MFKYKDLISSAIKIVMYHKYLWFFGFFAAFLTNGGIVQKLYSKDKAGFSQDWQRLQETGIFDFSIVNKIITLAQNDLSGLLLRMMVLLVVLVLGLFIFWLAIVSQGALIKSVANIINNKKSDFKLSLRNGISYFWSVFFFRIIERVTVFILIAAIDLTTAYAIVYSGNMVIKVSSIVLFVLAIVVIFTVMLVVRYSMSFNVIQDKRFIDAFTSGFNLFKNNILMSIEIGLIIFAINIALSFMVLMVISAATIPFILLMFVFYKLTFLAGLTFVLIMGTALLFVIVGLAGAMLSVFSDSLWTIFFINLLKESPVSRFNSIAKFFIRKKVV